MLLNLGGELEGYTNRDVKLGNTIYPLTDLESDSFDEVYASHVLEHFGWRETQKIINEWVRVLKPNRWIYIAVPDFEYLVGIKQLNWIEAYLMGGQIDDYDYHKSLYTQEKLTLLMLDAGLKDIQPFESFHHDCTKLPVSLNLKGRKDG